MVVSTAMDLIEAIDTILANYDAASVVKKVRAELDLREMQCWLDDVNESRPGMVTRDEILAYCQVLLATDDEIEVALDSFGFAPLAGSDEGVAESTDPLD